MSLQRTIANTYSSSNKRERINSVAKESKCIITPIEEAPIRVSKFKRSRQGKQKPEDKLAKAYEEAKKDLKQKKKAVKPKVPVFDKPRKLLHPRRLNSQDNGAPNNEEEDYDSPVLEGDKIKDINHFDKVKQLRSGKDIGVDK